METSDFTRDALRRGIREIYEDNRRMFLEMAARLTDADLSKPSANEELTIGELMFHIALSLEYVAEEVASACKGKNLSPMPKAVYDRLNLMLTRQQAKGQGLASILEKYEAAFDAAVKLLDEIGPDDWKKTTRFFYMDADVVELFRRQRQHHMEHFAQIQQVL
jgi:DinB family protein